MNERISHNLFKKELNALLSFSRKSHLKVVQCDKNVGVMVISKDYMDFLSYNHLNGNDTYQLLENDLTSEIVSEINLVLKYLSDNKNISKKSYNHLRIKANHQINAGKFRIMAKIHKDKFGIRPIIDCIRHPTERLCSFIDLILQPLVKSIKSILKDF